MSVLSLFFIAAAVFCITQWENIQAIKMGLGHTPEELEQMQVDLKVDFEQKTGIDLEKIEEMSKHINPDGTAKEEPSEQDPGTEDIPFTEEENGDAEDSPVSDPKTPQSKDNPKKPNGKTPSESKDTPKKDDPKKDDPQKKPKSNPKKDTSEVEAIMARFYALQSSFVGQLEGLKNSTIASYKAIPVGQRSVQKRAAMGRSAIAQATALEGQCDAQVASLLTELSAALRRAGMSQDLVSDVRYYYASQKSCLKASYMSQFSKYLS